MDGTDIRVPFFTNYDAKTGQWIVENHGVDPDILVDNDPIREQAGEDQQLDKAIEVALEQLKGPQAPARRSRAAHAERLGRGGSDMAFFHRQKIVGGCPAAVGQPPL